MTKEVLKLALEALERSVATCFDPYSHEQVMSRPEHFINQAITAIKAALEAKVVQVSPLEFVEMVMEKEHLVGNPIFWAEWPNKDKT
jgi:hypothetical protein